MNRRSYLLWPPVIAADDFGTWLFQPPGGGVQTRGDTSHDGQNLVEMFPKPPISLYVHTCQVFIDKRPWTKKTETEKKSARKLAPGRVVLALRIVQQLGPGDISVPGIIRDKKKNNVARSRSGRKKKLRDINHCSKGKEKPFATKKKKLSDDALPLKTHLGKKN